MKEIKNIIRWGMNKKEIKEFKMQMIPKMMEKYGDSKEEAEEVCDIWVEAVNQVARETGEII
jgi:ribosomal protein L20